MTLNTIKTILGYLRTIVEKNTKLNFRDTSLSDIYNYLEISERISTSGQPTEKQFGTIKSQGYEVVINLAPEDSDNSLQNEAGTTSKLGLKYIHIPVDFKNPTQSDFEKFTDAMQEHNGTKIWIHCAANMRVSAFLYKYRCVTLGEDHRIAKHDLDQIWEPYGVWKKFISPDQVDGQQVRDTTM